MKLDDFLEELILEQNNWTHERFMQEKDIKRQLKNKFTALIGRLNLLFEDLPDTYTAVPISVEKADMFQLYEYRLPTGELKKYEKERETIEKIFLCIVLLYDKIDHAENREFLKKFYFKAKKLFFKIGLRPYKTDYWRRKAIIKCLELLDTDKIDIGEEEAGVRKLRLEICLYSGQERKRSAFLENLQSHVTDKSKVILERKNKNRFERLMYKHPDLKKLYENYKDAEGYYNKKLSAPTSEEYFAPYGKIDTFRYIGDQYDEELTEVEYDFFKLLFKLFPLKNQGSGTKDIMGSLRKGQWERISKEDRDKIVGFIDYLFELNSLYRLTRYFRYETIGEIENKAEELRFMLNDPVRYRVIKSLSEMLLLVRSRTEASEEFLYELENALSKPYNKYRDREVELLQLMEGEAYETFVEPLKIMTDRNKKLLEFVLSMKCE